MTRSTAALHHLLNEARDARQAVTVADLANKLGLTEYSDRSWVSHTLTDLVVRGVLSCITPDRKRHRLYQVLRRLPERGVMTTPRALEASPRPPGAVPSAPGSLDALVGSLARRSDILAIEQLPLLQTLAEQLQRVERQVSWLYGELGGPDAVNSLPGNAQISTGRGVARMRLTDWCNGVSYETYRFNFEIATAWGLHALEYWLLATGAVHSGSR
jgi:hypothetical protein